MIDEFLFVKGADVAVKRTKRVSDPNPVISSEMHGDVLFVKGVDVVTHSSR